MTKPKKLNISFDYDFTLTNPNIAALVKVFQNAGHNISIISSRSTKFDCSDIYNKAHELHIYSITLTNRTSKIPYLLYDFIDIHFDDDLDVYNQCLANNIVCIPIYPIEIN